MLKSPYPWFGGKSSVAPLVWRALGRVRNFVDPFFGSGAVLLARPKPFEGTETVNDLDGLVSNFWRAIKADPEAVANHADWPVNENDLHARHVWLLNRKDSLQTRLEGDPDFFDAKVAGWWVWGLCCWIGSGWCSGKGPWQSVEMPDGTRKLVHLGDAGRGVNRQIVHLGNAGLGVNSQRVHDLTAYLSELAARLENVRVCCGDWSRVCGPTPTFKQGLTGVILDPPYANTAGRDPDLYRQESSTVAHDVRAWALSVGDDPQMRVVLCGYEGEHTMPPSWRGVSWKSHGGYGNQSDGRANKNAARERLWLSPHCLRDDDTPLFDEE